MPFKNPKDQGNAIFEDIIRESNVYGDGVTPKLRGLTGQPSAYRKLEKEWDDSYGRTQSDVKYNPFENYHRALGNWNDYIKKYEGQDPSVKGVLDWLNKNKGVLENPDPREYVATSYDENFYKQFPRELREQLDNIDDLTELVTTAKSYTKNGEYSPRQMVRYLTGKKHFFVDPYDQKENLINDILNIWRRV